MLTLLYLNTLFLSNYLFARRVTNNTQPYQYEIDNNINFHSLPLNYNYRATRSILKDYKGLMWFGTENGLVKFDGINITAYEQDADNPKSINSNVIFALFEDNNHNLWIGTSQGLNIYNRLQDNFFTLYNKTGQVSPLNQLNISSISAGKDSLIWIGTATRGLFSINIYSYQSESQKITFPGEENLTITSIYSGSRDNLWVGTLSGLVLFNPETNSSYWFQHNLDDPLSISGNYISSIQKDCNGNIWVSTQDKGINRIVNSGDTYTFERFSNSSDKSPISSSAINKLFADGYGNLWIGTENDGLNKFDIKTYKVEVYKNELGNDKSIASSSVWSIYGDNEGRVWIGSYNKGISVIDKDHYKFESYQTNPYTTITLPKNDVRGFCETNNGEKIWIATDGGGICRFELTTRTFDKVIPSGTGQKSLSNNAIQSIVPGSGNHIWVGSWGGGVDYLTSDGKFIKNYNIENKTGVGNNKTRTIYNDNVGNIWVGTNGSGLFLYNKTKDVFESFIYSNIISERSIISSIQSDSSNNYWLGTLTGLIYLKLDNSNNVIDSKVFTTNNSMISSNTINSIHIDINKNIWLGTNNGGANVFNPGKNIFRIYRKKDGLSSNNISGILEDNEHNIWISTNEGISKIDINTSEITIYKKEDGLVSNEFYSKSCLKTKNGSLLFGSKNGFNVLYPGQIKTNMRKPKILLTGLRINNNPVDVSTKSTPLKKQLSETDTLVLNYTQTSFSIDFVALNYTRPDQNQFEYILDGYDNDWVYNGRKTSANYTKVKPGKYTFKVKGSNNDGIWNEVPTTLYIIIKPPIWKTTGAYSFYSILIITFIILIFKAWQERIHIRNQLELERLAKEKEYEMNEKNLQFFMNVSHEFRTPLSLIIGPVESLLHSSPLEMHEKLKVVQRNSHRLLSLTNNLIDLRKLEEGGMRLKVRKVDIKKTMEHVLDFFKVRIKKQKINLSVKLDEPKNDVWLDSEKFTTIMFNLLSNAIKHTTENGNIHIDIEGYKTTNQLEISITNTGIGIEPSEQPFIFDKFYQAISGREQGQFGSGIGLSLTKGLVELHGGKISVTDTQNGKTKFSFFIPVNKSVYKPEDLWSETSDILASEICLEDYEDEEIKNNIQKKENEKPLILIIEDNADLRLFLKKELEQTYIVNVAKDGKEGFQKAYESIPDLIISDIVMPKMNGIDLCKTVKNDIRTSHIPIILLTAKANTKEQIKGFDTGADAYVTKPFHLKLLQTQIANLINSRKALYSQFSQDVYIIPHKKAKNEIDQLFLQQTIDFILENINDSKLSIETLAKLHNMSHRNFYRKVRALTGNTVVEFIKIIRLKKALKLIESHQYNISEISYMIGFSSPSYFTKSFREFYGKPPTDYLNQ